MYKWSTTCVHICRAAAHEAMENFHEGVEDMKRVVALEPGNRLALDSLRRLQAAADAKLEKQKEEMLGAPCSFVLQSESTKSFPVG